MTAATTGASAASSASGTSSAAARASSTDMRSTLRTPRSTWETQATDRSTIRASSGWDKPRRRRSAAIFRPRAFW